MAFSSEIMSQRQFSIFMILMGVALVWSANGLCFTLVALRMSSEQFATYEIGIVTPGYFIGQIICAGFLENVISKVDNIRAFAALASTGAIPSRAENHISLCSARPKSL